MKSDTELLNTPTYVRLRERLRTDIVSGVWPLGQHVTLSELSAHYGVSANPVREALLQLQGDGIVEMRVHRGAIIPLPDYRYVSDVYDLNGAIQAMLAATAAVRATPADLARIEAAALDYERKAAAGEPKVAVMSNREFHRTINQVAGNAPAVEVMEGRSSLVDAVRAAIGYGAGRIDQVIAQHRAIVTAILSGDPEAAARASRAHTESSKADLLASMRRRDDTLREEESRARDA